MLRSTRFIWLALCISLLVCTGLALLLSAGSTSPVLASGEEIRFKDSGGNWLNGELRLLCFNNDISEQPFADIILHLENGYPLPETPVPAGCHFLAALHQVHAQPAHNREGLAFEVFRTSWPPGSNEPQPIAPEIELRDEWSLILYHIVVSIGWEPAPDSEVLESADMVNALRETSAKLYDWTEGQMAIGPVTVHTGGRYWSSADIRVLPANDYRPSAFVGGVVSTSLTFPAAITDVNYSPAMTYLGRQWNGEEAYHGNWQELTGTATIAHEWSHYVLFLYDEYQQEDGKSGYCICDDLNLPSGCGFDDRDGSAMAYFYLDAEGNETGSEFWHRETHGTGGDSCELSRQMQVHMKSDWEALKDWHIIQQLQGLPFEPVRNPATLNAGPSVGLVGHLFGAKPGFHTMLPLLLSGEGIINLPAEFPMEIAVAASLPTTRTLPAQVYLYKQDDSSLLRILPQGKATGAPTSGRMGAITLLDVEPDDRLRIFVDRYGNDSESRYTLFAGDDIPADIVPVHDNNWRYQVEHDFQIEAGLPQRLTISFHDIDNALSQPMVELCEIEASSPCRELLMTRPGGEWWFAEFATRPEEPELPRYLVFRIKDAGGILGPEWEIVQWVQMAGGVGPGHKDGMAPLLDAAISVNTADPIPDMGDCNGVSYMPASDFLARTAMLTNGYTGIIGQPLDISILLTTGACPTVVAGQDTQLPTSPPVLLTMYYSQDEVDRLGIAETQLDLLHYDRNSGWVLIQKEDQDTNLNWISAEIWEDGIYAIGHP